ncbi:LamG-like jellyroll fold domain-containing protein [Streptosporangium sp. NPDC049078]|uniref:LamG-like jellyroll fold domain-containing protein n=1 Tax=Streptosporangium sp. NPDC049078 TaxID=3155767 RepID=UPI00342351F5
MSVRFDASGEAYSRATGWGVQSAFTVCCWVKAAIAPSLRTVWHVHNGDGTNYARLSGTFDGFSLNVVADDASGPLGSMSVSTNTWYFVGIAVSGSSGRRVSKPEGGSFTTSTWGSGTGSVNIATLRVGASDTTWWNGSLAGFKIWTAALSQAEMEAEAAQFAPVRTSNLRAYYRFATPSTTDDSGNSQTLTGGTGAATDTDPALATTIPLTDTGAASDALSTSATVPLTDTASAADTLTVTRQIALTDTASAADALTVSATVQLADAGAAADTMFNGQPVAFEDTGTAVDALTVDGVAAPLAESASAAEALTVSAAVPLADTASAVDELSVSEVFFPELADTGAAVDSLTVVEVKDRHAVALPLRRAWSSTPPTT